MSLARYGNHRVLVALLVIDVCFALLHVAGARFGLPIPGSFYIDVDWGLPEIYQYAKELTICVALAAIAVKSRRPDLGIWSAFFAYLLLDDSLRLHERTGTFINRTWNVSTRTGFDGQVIGEVLAAAVFGFVFLLIVVLVATTSRVRFRLDQTNGVLIFLTVCLVFFGVLVDAFKNLLPPRDLAYDIIEDGGEMVVMSLIVWVSLSLYRQPRNG